MDCKLKLVALVLLTSAGCGDDGVAPNPELEGGVYLPQSASGIAFHGKTTTSVRLCVRSPP